MSAAQVALGTVSGGTHMVGLARVQGNAIGLACCMSGQRLAFWRNVNRGVVLGGHDDEGAGLVVGHIIVEATCNGLVVALDDVFVAEALDGQDEGRIEGNVGDVGAIDRDGVGRDDFDGFLRDGFIFGLAVVALRFGNVDGRDVVGADGEGSRPSRQGVADGARAVAFGTDEHLCGDPISFGVVPEAVLHERQPKLLALR